MFRDRLSTLFPELREGQLDALEAHYRLLVRWNRVLNLTRILDEEEAAERHYGEGLWLASQLPAGVGCAVDVGSGAGFPGFPIAVARPGMRVVLVESHRRKAVFLQEAARGVMNVEVAPSRIEEVGGSFEWAVCRAVRWEEIEAAVDRLAGYAAVLGGGEAPGPGCFEWDPPVQLPWGKHRFLYMGRRRRFT